MTASPRYVLTCDKPGCDQAVTGYRKENAAAVRLRARQELGWRFRGGGAPIDLCRFHA